MKIKILDQDTILKIAAGEVIERPASVVKELVDNAVDAGAGSIIVEIFDGGREKIVVTDDGEGMTPEDLILAVERHSTSKISSGRDLFAISTMGFRGEALASIGAISAMTITTRTKNALGGSKLFVRGGEKGEVQSASSPVGTKITVTDLFFNTPARKKFLRKASTEFTAIHEVCQQQVLAAPGIRFKLLHNGKSVLVAPGNGSLVAAIASLMGTELAENLFACSLARDNYSVAGYVASPKYHRSNRAMQYFTVNRRPVSLRLMGSAVEKAFHTLLPVNRYPIAFLNLNLPGSEVDVNVHPTKKEVKFADSSTIYRLVYQACLQALAPVTAPSPERGESLERDFTPWPRLRPSLTYTNTPERQQRLQETAQLGFEPVFSHREADWEILGQVFSTFIVVATPEELRLVDQHAAQERILYERFLHLLQSGTRPGQVVIPVETPLSGRASQYIRASLPRLTELGFNLELTDSGMIVKEVPILFKKILSSEDILEIVEKLEEYESTEYGLNDYSQTALMLLACKGAIKAKQKLSASEARQLLEDLQGCENSRTCPHGRPIWVAFDRVNLEKMFARR